ncbi:MAG: hypothetical protein DRP57_05300 [Spirochaetes bacterium]|nr:MAG: hypothetical protein DRP57_05300 [Spirochaetota bacterium]
MSKVSVKAKQRYSEKIKAYKGQIESIEKRAKAFELDIKRGIQGENYKRITLANNALNLLSNYVLLNELSVSLLGVKNEAYLNEARKYCYKCIIYLEEVVSGSVDVPFSDYEERLMSIKAVTDKSRYNLLKKLGYSIETVKEGFGENSKWKWSFVELEGRYAAVAKNLIDLRSFVAKLDPRIEGYSERIAHLNLVKRLLNNAADRYREKYELSTHHFDDIKLAIHFLAALRRINILLGETEEMDIIKRKIEIWKAKMESDMKKAELARKKEKLKQQNL